MNPSVNFNLYFLKNTGAARRSLVEVWERRQTLEQHEQGTKAALFDAGHGVYNRVAQTHERRSLIYCYNDDRRHVYCTIEDRYPQTVASSYGERGRAHVAKRCAIR